METYLFKFSACLALFWLVYILFLERQTMHRFKRFYLLAAIATALIIPALTITHYIEPIVTDFEVLPAFIPKESSFAIIPQVQASFWGLETVLWIVYGLGVLLFSLRFIVNLFKMYKRISDNETLTKSSFIYVLLEECRIPHSFFKYLFFDKSKYETNSIPDEVKLHEETHAKQLHSLDIIAIELLQIVFWFHPLVYILKHHIKLNHEFLADQAVLEEGIDAKIYQNILLQFSSNTDEYQLSSAINYSSIKKRFTVMKTQTSKTRIWASNFLLLPIIALLFYSFAEREYVEKVTLPPSHSINDHFARSIDLKVLNDNSYLVDGIKATKQTFIDVFNQLHKDITPDVRNNIINIHVTSSQEISNKETWFIYNALQDYGFYRIVTPNQDINRAKGNTPFAIESSLLTQEKATAKQVATYNTWAKKIHGESKVLSDDATFFPPINEQNLIKFSEIYKRMSSQQKNQSIEFPFPGLDVNDGEHNYPSNPRIKQQIATKKQIAEYNAWAKKINAAIKKANEDKSYEYPIIKQKEVERYIHIYNNLMTDEQRKNAELLPLLPPPPPPPPSIKGEVNDSQIETYNNWIKNLKDPKGNYKMIKKEDYKYFMSIYNLMTNEQKKKTAGLPPPPPPPEKPKDKSGPLEINGATYYFSQQNGVTTYFDQYGKVVDINKIPPPPPIPKDATPEQKAKMKKATDAYMKANPDKVGKAKAKDGEVFDVIEVPEDLQGSVDINGETFYYTSSNGKTTYYNRYGKVVKMDNLPPPPPSKNPSFLEYIIDMETKGATFFMDGKKITANEAKAIAKNNKGKGTEMITQKDKNGKYVVKLSNQNKD